MNREQLAISNELLTKKCFPRSNSLLFVFFIALCSLFFMLCSCQNPLLPPKRGASLPANTGSFSFTIGGNNARTILPSTPVLGDFAMYTLAFTAAGGGAVNLSVDRTNSTLGNPFVLAAGTYNLTVNAYKDTGKTQLMAQGTLSGIIITAGGNTARSVVLSPLLGETGTSGTFSWDIGISASGITFSAASMIIKDSAGVQSDIVVDLTATPSGSRTLASGVYIVTFNLEGTESGVKKAVVFNEILYIYSELTSRFPSSGIFTFTDSHFHNTHWNITFDQNYSGGGSVVQSVEHGGTYTITAPTRSGYMFIEWNTAANGSGSRYIPGDSITVTADITLYAQWFSYIETLEQQLAAVTGDTEAAPVSITLDPAVFTTAATVPDGVIGWGEITTAVKNAAKYVVLDLSACAFDGNIITGKATASGNDMNTANSTYIKGIILPSTLETIGDYAFRDCSRLTGALTIPSGVTSIGDYVFYGCSGFTGALTIPSGVTSIGSYAFRGCSSLTGALTIPDTVTTIGTFAFQNCSGFTGALTISANVTIIGDRTFYGCSGLSGALTIPSNVTIIETYAFYGCSGLTGTLTIPSSVISIADNAFDSCSGLSGSVIIPDGITSIAGNTFRGCTNLAGVDIPATVDSIAANAFYNCTGLASVKFGKAGVTIAGTTTFINAANSTALQTAYTTGGAGTYVKSGSGTTITVWTKQS